MSAIQAAPKQLAQLAVAMRGWDYEEIRTAIIAASHAGWDDARIYRETFRLLLLEDATPADLRHACRSPLQRDAATADALTAAAKAREMYPALRHHDDPQDGAA